MSQSSECDDIMDRLNRLPELQRRLIVAALLHMLAIVEGEPIEALRPVAARVPLRPGRASLPRY